MKKLSNLVILLFFVAFGSLFGQNYPEQLYPPKLISDFADVFTEHEEQQLENKLVSFNDTTSTQIAVVSIISLEGYEVASYAFGLAEKWGIGQTGSDNGLLILIAKEDREVYIATGYGLEAYVTDAVAKRIIENNIVPNFKLGAFYTGIDEATDRIIGLVTGAYSADDFADPITDYDYTGRDDYTQGIVITIVFILFILLLMFLGNKYGDKFGSNTSSGRSYRSSGGWSSSSSWGGGGYSSGGGGSSFGGFGGGSFGGGGAGGSW